MKDLFHGTTYDINEIDVTMGRGYKDFGKGFQVISLYLVHRISEEENCSNEVALKKLLKTMTYELLQDKESELYAESPEYVWSMLSDEKNGNMESWIKE